MPKSSIFQTRSLPSLVYDALVQRITSGQWKPGTMIPSESDLAEELQVSVGTVRKALQVLREHHLIERSQGRGTFVLDHSTEGLPIRFSNFYDRQGQRISGQIVDRSIEKCTYAKEELKQLGARSAEQCTQIHQVRAVNGVKFLSETWVFNTSTFPGLTDQENFPHRVAVIAQQYGIVLEKALEELELLPVSERSAKDLDLAPEMPTMHLTRRTLGVNGKLISLRRAFFILPPGIKYQSTMK